MITASTLEQANNQALALQMCARLREKNTLAFDMFFRTFEKAYTARLNVTTKRMAGLTDYAKCNQAIEMLDAVWVECLYELRQSINTERAENEYCGRFGFDIFTDDFYDSLTAISIA